LLPGADGPLPPDFVRQHAPASRILEQLFPTTPWWVGYDGKTLVGTRAQEEVTTSYDLLDYDARHKVAKGACDDPGAIVVGSILRGRLRVPFAVREIVLKASRDALRMTVWGREVIS